MKKKYLILFALIGLSLTFFSCEKETPVITPTVTTDGSSKVVQDEFEGIPIVVIGNSKNQFMIAYERTLIDGIVMDFTVEQRALPVVMKDAEGNKWDLEGNAVEGPRTGQKLRPLNSYIGFWFAWGTMFPGIKMYDGTPYTGNFVQEPASQGWTLPKDRVLTVLGQDGIPAIDNPKFETFNLRASIDDGFFVKDNELVIGVTVNETTRIYPHSILNWHEIVNDNIDDFYFSLSFCPITGTAIMWDRTINGVPSTFGVSGLLYNGNVIPYDRQTGSLWSQMKQNCINGDLIGDQMNSVQVLETTWATWKLLKEAPEVLTTETGFGKDYTVNPYRRYIEDHSHLSYPVEYDDDRLPRKERVLGIIINGKAKAFRFKDFE